MREVQKIHDTSWEYVPDGNLRNQGHYLFSVGPRYHFDSEVGAFHAMVEDIFRERCERPHNSEQELFQACREEIPDHLVRVWMDTYQVTGGN